MTTSRPRRPRPLPAVLAAVTALLLLGGPALAAGADTADGAADHRPDADRPTVVLVHGAFADSSGWEAVTQRLLDRGYPVIAFSNPLRGPVVDGEYLRAFLDTIAGPIVLVGHSYGGAVITNAATGDPDVTALVYVAAYALDEGESVQAANALGGGHTEVVDHLVVRPIPGATDGNADAFIDPAHFHRLFADDLPRRTTRFMAATQRPGALASLVTPSGSPAWRTIPSWFLVAGRDRIIPPEAQRAMAARAGSTTVEIASSHVAMMSRPGVVARLVQDAARASATS